MSGFPNEITSGKDAVREKNEQWLANVQEFHSGDISDPVVAGDHFSYKMSFDVPFKTQENNKWKNFVNTNLTMVKLYKSSSFTKFLHNKSINKNDLYS